jgi:hypothetical protein
MKLVTSFPVLLTTIVIISTSCKDSVDSKPASAEITETTKDSPEYFSLRPALEKMYCYTQAVKKID